MSQKLAKITLIAAIAVSLSGCAQIGKLGGDMWGYTKSAANFVASPVTKLLRSAPEPAYVFEEAPQEAVKTAFAGDGQTSNRTDLIVPQLAQLPVPQTPNYQEPVYTPQSYQSIYGNPPVSPSRVVEARPTAPLAAPRTTQDISFIKMGGGSNMHDWLMCETEAQGFVRVVEGGYIIEPAFEACMRSKGYKPESEVSDLIGDTAS